MLFRRDLKRAKSSTKSRKRKGRRPNVSGLHWRRLCAEPLEDRLLLSITPALQDDNTAAFYGGDGADNLYLRVAPEGVLEFSETGGDDAYLRDLDPVTAGDQTLTITPSTLIAVELAGGDDTLIIQLSDSVHIEFEGGDGDGDTLLGPEIASTWEITGANAGTLNGQISFNGVENLAGSVDNQDTFVFTPDGSLSGTVDGGAAGFDTLVLDGGSFETVSFIALGAGSGEVWRDADAIRYSGLEPIVDNTDSANRVISLTNDADTDATLSAASATELALTGSTFASITFPVPTQSLTIDGLAGTDVVTIESIDLGSANLVVLAESIFVSSGAEVKTDGNVTLTAVAENTLAGSSSPSPLDVTAQILVEGNVNVGGSLTLEATVNNTVDLDASGASLAIESGSNASAQIGSGANVKAGNLTVSAVTNTHFTVDITNATSGASGLGETVVDGGRGNLTLLPYAGPAEFYLWNSDDLDLEQATYVVTHGWTDGLHKLPKWMPLLNSLEQRYPEANIIFTNWSGKSTNPYWEAADDTFEIGDRLATFLQEKEIRPETTTLIGHSLGGQVSGVAGGQYQSNTGKSIARIFALDPAGPGFEPTPVLGDKPLDERLDAGDAVRVVALHTTSILGYDDPLADLDLYVNPDTPFQPGQANFIGNHSYAVTLLTELLQGESFSQTPPQPGRR